MINTKPQSGINTLLWPVHVCRYLNLTVIE